MAKEKLEKTMENDLKRKKGIFVTLFMKIIENRRN